jgi:hypothetical protein
MKFLFPVDDGDEATRATRRLKHMLHVCGSKKGLTTLRSIGRAACIDQKNLHIQISQGRFTEVQGLKIVKLFDDKCLTLGHLMYPLQVLNK